MCHGEGAGEIKDIRGVLGYMWCSSENTDVTFFIKVN